MPPLQHTNDKSAITSQDQDNKLDDSLSMNQKDHRENIYIPSLEKSSSCYIINNKKLRREEKPFADGETGDIYRLVDFKAIKSKYVVKCAPYTKLKKEFDLAPPFLQQRLLILCEGSTPGIYANGRLVSLDGGETIENYLNKNLTDSPDGILLGMKIILGAAEQLSLWHEFGYSHNDIHRDQFIYNGEKVTLIDSETAVKEEPLDKAKDEEYFHTYVIIKIKETLSIKCPTYHNLFPKIGVPMNIKDIVHTLKESIKSMEDQQLQIKYV